MVSWLHHILAGVHQPEELLLQKTPQFPLVEGLEGCTHICAYLALKIISAVIVEKHTSMNILFVEGTLHCSTEYDVQQMCCGL